MPKYTEAISYIYSSNTFVIRNVDNMYYIPSFLPPQRLNTICSLLFILGISIRHGGGPLLRRFVEVDEDHLKYWAEVWRTLSGMRSLRVLHVDLRPVNNAGYFYQRASLQVALEPVEKKGEGGWGTFSLHLPISSVLWWHSKDARSALAAMEGIYQIDGHDGLLVQVPEWAK